MTASFIWDDANFGCDGWIILNGTTYIVLSTPKHLIWSNVASSNILPILSPIQGMDYWRSRSTYEPSRSLSLFTYIAGNIFAVTLKHDSMIWMTSSPAAWLMALISPEDQPRALIGSLYS